MAVSNSDPTSNATFGLSFGAQAGGTYSHYCINENSSSVAACVCTAGTLPASHPVTSGDGSIALTVWLRDAAGNVSTPRASAPIVLDTAIPTVAISLPAAGTYANAANVAFFPVSGTCSENGRNVVITGDATATVACAAGAWSTNLDFSAAAAGTISISIAHSDAAGNAATATRSFVKDVTAPSLVLTSFTGGGAVAGGVAANITWTSSELNPATTPISLAYSTNSGGAWTDIALNEADDGSYSWTVPSLDITTARDRAILVDAAGNSTTTTSGSNFVIDSSAPVFTAAEASSSPSSRTARAESRNI